MFPVMHEQVKERLDAEGMRFAVPPRDITLRQPDSTRKIQPH
jgi:hypothetical protein